MHVPEELEVELHTTAGRTLRRAAAGEAGVRARLTQLRTAAGRYCPGTLLS